MGNSPYTICIHIVSIYFTRNDRTKRKPLPKLCAFVHCKFNILKSEPIQKCSFIPLTLKFVPNGATAGQILDLRPASERRRYNATPSMIVWEDSLGALAKKSCQPWKKCRKLKFSGKLLGCPLNTTVKSPRKSRRRKILYTRWPPSPPVDYYYTLKSCKFLNVCHRKTILGCIPMFWNTENTVESLFQY